MPQSLMPFQTGAVVILAFDQGHGLGKIRTKVVSKNPSTGDVMVSTGAIFDEYGVFLPEKNQPPLPRYAGLSSPAYQGKGIKQAG